VSPAPPGYHGSISGVVKNALDTLELTATRMREDKRDYITRLIRVWQRAVYGGQAPDSGALHGLCDEFAPALDTV